MATESTMVREPARLIAALLVKSAADAQYAKIRSERLAAEEATRQAERARLDQERTQAEQTARTVRQQRSAIRTRRDSLVLRAGVLAIVTVGVPFLIGKYVWRKHLYTDGFYLPWPHPNLPFGSLFLPEVMFGAGIVAAAVGLLLLRPPWTAMRPVYVAAAIAFLIAGVVLPITSTSVAKHFADSTRTRWRNGPVNVKALGGACGYYWTSRPDAGGAVKRWFAYPTGKCKFLVLYQGWKQLWHVPAPANGWFQTVYSYSPLVVSRVNIANHPNLLIGYDLGTGRVKWRWACGDHDASYLDNETYYGYDQNFSSPSDADRYIDVQCSYGQVRVNAITGRSRRL